MPQMCLEQWACKREHQACDDVPGDDGGTPGGTFRRTILQRDKEIDPNWMLVGLWSHLYGLFSWIRSDVVSVLARGCGWQSRPGGAGVSVRRGRLRGVRSPDRPCPQKNIISNLREWEREAENRKRRKKERKGTKRGRSSFSLPPARRRSN